MWCEPITTRSGVSISCVIKDTCKAKLSAGGEMVFTVTATVTLRRRMHHTSRLPVAGWLLNRLKLKTEAERRQDAADLSRHLVIGISSQSSLRLNFSLRVWLSLSGQCYLGVVLDNQLSVGPQVSAVSRSCGRYVVQQILTQISRLTHLRQRWWRFVNCTRPDE